MLLARLKASEIVEREKCPATIIKAGRFAQSSAENHRFPERLMIAPELWAFSGLNDIAAHTKISSECAVSFHVSLLIERNLEKLVFRSWIPFGCLVGFGCLLWRAQIEFHSVATKIAFRTIASQNREHDKFKFNCNFALPLSEDKNASNVVTRTLIQGGFWYVQDRCVKFRMHCR